MSNVKIFEQQDLGSVRAFFGENGNVWFVAKDVCEALKHSNPSVAIQNLDDDEKGVSTIYTLGGNQEMATVNESGLYSLIFKSRKPEAKRFRKWVTSEVLPAIRKTGQYAVPKPIEKKPAHIEIREIIATITTASKTIFIPYSLTLDLIRISLRRAGYDCPSVR